MTDIEEVEQLKAQHAALETKIEEENRRPLPDETYIHQLKRQKLHIKDELLRLDAV